jgi:hypothetical protein
MPPTPGRQTLDETTACPRSPALVALAAGVLEVPLRRLVHKLDLVHEMARTHFRGRPFTFRELALRAAVFAWDALREDPYASEKGLAERRVDALAAGMQRAERRNILLDDLHRHGSLRPPRRLTLCAPREALTLFLLARHFRKAGRAPFTALLGHHRGRACVTLPPGVTPRTHLTLSGALYALLRWARASGALERAWCDFLEGPMPEAAFETARSYNGWAHFCLGRGRTPLDALRVSFFHDWERAADSEAAAEEFWRTQAWRGHTRARSLRKWVHAAMLGGYWPAQAREIGRSLLARDFLQLREGERIVCGVCRRPILPSPHGTDHRCERLPETPILPAARPQFQLRHGSRGRSAEFQHCRRSKLACEPRELFTVTGPVNRSTAKSRAGVSFHLSREWARARLTFAFAGPAPGRARLTVNRVSGPAGEEEVLAELVVAGIPGDKALADGWRLATVQLAGHQQPLRVQAGAFRVVPGEPAEEAEGSRKARDRRRPTELVLPVLDEAVHAVRVLGLKKGSRLRCTLRHDECGHYWPAEEPASKKCPRCGGEATARRTTALLPAEHALDDGVMPPPPPPNPWGRVPCDDPDCPHGVCSSLVAVEELPDRTGLLVLECRAGHRTEVPATREQLDFYRDEAQGRR